MPADRQRALKAKKGKKEGADVHQLTWTIPVEAGIGSPMSYASASMDETQLALDSPAASALQEPVLFPHIHQYDPDAPSSKAVHAKKKDDNYVPRPPNAFILFRSSFIKSKNISSDVEGDHSTLSKIIGITWKGLPDNEREYWHEQAREVLAEHKRKYPGYAFRPLHPRGQPSQPKRKVREVAPKDIGRCAKIAELLVEGKKGSDLEQAMAEFDKNNVKPIVARFEEPLTARQFRKRSCSQPPELESSSSARSARFMPPSPKPSKRRERAASSQPSARAGKRKAKSSPSTPSPSTPAPSSPKLELAIPDIAEETYNEMPPLVLPSNINPEPAFHPGQFSLGDIPSFDFTFAFHGAQAAQIDSCDPLALPVRPTSGSSVASQSQMPIASAYPSLRIDTSSIYDSWSAPSSSPPPCTPSSYSGELPPPFSAISQTAPDYFSGYPSVPGPFEGHAYPPAPPYVETAPFPVSMGEYGLSKDEYPFYAHKLMPEDASDAQLYLTPEMLTFSM